MTISGRQSKLWDCERNTSKQFLFCAVKQSIRPCDADKKPSRPCYRLLVLLVFAWHWWDFLLVDHVTRVLMTALVFVIPSYILIFPPSRASNEQHVRCEMKGYHSWSCYKAPSLCLCIFTCGLIDSRCVWHGSIRHHPNVYVCAFFALP